jgi:hypothetical protein
MLVSSTALQSSAQPPRPGTDDNGLTENESATLWSRDNDSRYISNAAYRDAYGENRTAIQQIANGTDLTFRQPPATAARWTSADHEEFAPGDASTSVYPPHANRTNGSLVRDAHATIFAVTPSTTVHAAPGETVTYAAPTGTVRGVVDYRVVAGETFSGTGTVIGRSHRITEIRLRRDGEVIDRTSGSHQPELPYELVAGTETLQLEADIQVTVTRRIPVSNTTNASAPSSPATPSNASGGNPTASAGDGPPTRVRSTTETVTAVDRIEVRTYDLDPQVATARYPDGDLGIAVYRQVPWQGLSLTVNGSHRVRGIWRFYTARDPRWDTLLSASTTGTSRVDSPALPVGVHAYPSRLGPRVEPTHGGPRFLEIWGTERSSPAGTLPKTVLVDVVERPYTSSFGLAIRSPAIDTEEARVQGIVRGVNASLASDTTRHLRESDLEVRVVDQSADQATLYIELTDAETGAPITLAPTTDPRYKPIVEGRDGYIAIAGRHVRTNASGQATITVQQSGVYTARYVPGSWLTHDPAYTAAADTARWHPLVTIGGWFELLLTAIQWFLPFALAVYAGRRLGEIFTPRGRFE